MSNKLFKVDGDGSGSIDFPEFLQLIAGKMKTFSENEISITLNPLSRLNSNSISCSCGKQ